MIKKTLYFFVLLCSVACGQKKDIHINPEIKNSKTAAHVSIPGTRLYIIPPKNFVVAKTFIGLQKGQSHMLNIYDLVGGNYYTNAATFSRSAFEQQGAKVSDFKEIKVNGYPAKYVAMQGEPGSKVYGLVFGDTSFSTMIMGIYPVADETTGKEIIAALNSIWYDPTRKIDPFETANFTLNDKVSRFKFFQYNAGLYVYSIDGVEYSQDQEAPMVIVTQLPMDNSMSLKDIAEMMMAKGQQYGFTNAQLKNTSTEQTNGYTAYTTEVYGQMQGKNSLIYYSIVANGDKAIVVQGIAKKDLENNLREFKLLANTITVK